MADNLKNYINRKFGTQILSKWIVLGFDIVITIFTYGLAYILRFNFNIAIISFSDFINNTLITSGVFATCYLIFKSYDGIIRHSGIADAERLIKAGLTATLLCILISAIYRNLENGYAILPVSIAIIHLVLTISMLAFSRYVIKVLFYQSTKNTITPIPVIIYGAGRRGVSVLQALRNNISKNYQIDGFLDDNNSKIGKTIEGVKIYATNRFTELAKRYAVKELIIGIHALDVHKKNAIIDICLKNQINVKSVPPVEDWINGKLSFQQIRAINIEDLLGREPIQLENEQILHQLAKKTILITGAAGSIGSELVKQVLNFNPGKLILVDQAETALYDLNMELFFRLQNLSSVQVEFIVCDITNFKRISTIFEEHQPSIVFHAAAYKHVPLMELNPLEAIHVNVFGTKNLVDLAVTHALEKFIFISSDKAINPTNVMGATKRAAEIYVQETSKQSNSDTIFITTRFGNVLGSNGSVVNYFRKQIEAGGPLTITHPEVTRYFMTITEATKLVLEAATMGKTNEIYLFDMGAPVKILDLAHKMVMLSGLKPELDIAIAFTGLRPGEKLHEELLHTNENSVQTHHHKIKIAVTNQYNVNLVSLYIEQLWNVLQKGDSVQAVTILKDLIPEYISQNSKYQELDKHNKNSVFYVN